MKISKEVYDALVGWREYTLFNQYTDIFMNAYAIDNLPKVVDDWWADFKVDVKESNNRLIAIIRWVNGEDVFEVEEPKKWVVRSKGTDEDDHYWYVFVENDIVGDPENYWGATRFDTKEEAESWANSHQEVVEVEG